MANLPLRSLAFALTVFTLTGSAWAEDIYRCQGVYQNRPCASGVRGEKVTDKLPSVSRVAPEDLFPPVAEREGARARMRPPAEEVVAPTHKDDLGAVEQSVETLQQRVFSDRTAEATKAQWNELQRLRGKVDPLCTSREAARPGGDTQRRCQTITGNLNTITTTLQERSAD